MRSPLLALALALHAALATAYAWRTPAFEGPDENSHYEYAWHVANAGSLPVASAYAVEHGLPQLDGAALGHHPPLYYALVGGVLRLCGADDTVFGPRLNPRFGDPAAPSRHLRFVHEEREDHVLFALRMVSVLLGAITIACVHRLGRVCCPAAPRVADLAALLVACLPMWSALHGVLNSDVLAATLSSAVLLQLATMLRSEKVTALRAAGLGLLLGAALLTKLTTLFLVGLAGLVAIVLLARRRASLGAVGAAAAVAAAASAWVFVRNAALYGDPLALAVHDASFQPIPDVVRYHNLLGTGPWPESLPPFVPTVFTSLLGRFGWFTVAPHPVLVWSAAVVLGLAAFGWIVTLCERPGATAGPSVPQDRPGPAGGGGAACRPRPAWLLLLAALLVLGGTTWFNIGTHQPQGRLLFPAVAPAAVLLAAGLVRIGREIHASRALLALLPLTAGAVFYSTFLPALDPSLAPAPVDHRSLVGGIVAPAVQPTIVWVDPPGEAPRANAPTLRFRDDGAPDGARYTLYAFDDDGRVWLATHEWKHGGVVIDGPDWQVPDAIWAFLPKGVPLQLRLRRVPDAADQDPATLPCSDTVRVTRS